MVFVNKKQKITEISSQTSYGEWLLQYLRKYSSEGKLAQVWADNGAEISYADLLRETLQVAAGLQAMGAKSGDTMSFVTRNSPELYKMVLGCILADVTVAPSVAELSANELRQNFLSLQPNFILSHPKNTPTVQEALDCAEICPKPEIISFDEATYREILSKGSLADPNTFRPVKIKDPQTHVFACLFSSGTTGKQKSVMVTDYEFFRQCTLTRRLLSRDAGLVMSTSQLSWVSWFFSMTRCTIACRPLLFLNKTTEEDILQAIHKFKPTTWLSYPPQLISIQRIAENNPGRWNMSSLKLIITGGDVLSGLIQERLSKKLNVDIHQEYGSTEFGIVTSSDADGPMVYGSAGKPVVPMKLVDIETEEEITEPNKIGEIRLQTAITIGYRGNPEATAELRDKDGWFKTGDLGYLNENDDFFFVDRIKEMMKYRGCQVSPSELEDLIRKIPGVKEVGVSSKKDPEDGDIIAAFVVKVSGSRITDKDIVNALAKEKLHDSKQLRGGVIFVDELPKNSNGKLTRRRLADILNGSSLQKNV